MTTSKSEIDALKILHLSVIQKKRRTGIRAVMVCGVSTSLPGPNTHSNLVSCLRTQLSLALPRVSHRYFNVHYLYYRPLVKRVLAIGQVVNSTKQSELMVGKEFSNTYIIESVTVFSSAHHHILA